MLVSTARRPDSQVRADHAAAVGAARQASAAAA
jgi:hypothetical protein